MSMQSKCERKYIITAGPAYIDIDAYACCVAMQELLQLQGENAISYSTAPCNYSVCKFLIEEKQIADCLPPEFLGNDTNYIIVDVSDPDFLKESIPLDRVISVYDHHVGFEKYWSSRLGDAAHIEHIGAAATLVYRAWKNVGLVDNMQSTTARLLVAAILDNTLNFTSFNTTPEDINAFEELSRKENIDDEWCARYFSEVQESVEADLKKALLGDLKTVSVDKILPRRIAQLCVWDTNVILDRLLEIREWLSSYSEQWMLNIIDIKHRCSYFVCDSSQHQKEMEQAFHVSFHSGVAKTEMPYLRKELIKKALS